MQYALDLNFCGSAVRYSIVLRFSFGLDFNRATTRDCPYGGSIFCASPLTLTSALQNLNLTRRPQRVNQMNTNKNISGRVWLLGDHINTDLIHPPSCFSLDETKMKNGLRVGMERLNMKIDPDDDNEDLVIVAGDNFGCGSSRETSVRALFAFGVKAIVAKSFARIFYRSLVNRGIAPLICRKAHDNAADGDMIKILIDKQQIIPDNNKPIPFIPFDPHIKKILECGGLISYLKRELSQNTRI